MIGPLSLETFARYHGCLTGLTVSSDFLLQQWIEHRALYTECITTTKPDWRAFIKSQPFFGRAK